MTIVIDVDRDSGESIPARQGDAHRRADGAAKPSIVGKAYLPIGIDPGVEVTQKARQHFGPVGEHPGLDQPGGSPRVRQLIRRVIKIQPDAHHDRIRPALGEDARHLGPG